MEQPGVSSLLGPPRFVFRRIASDDHPNACGGLRRLRIRKVPHADSGLHLPLRRPVHGRPQMMVAVPVYNLMIALGLISNLLSLILVHSAWGIPWIILFMRNFFRTLPEEIEEAARVDGASDFKIFYKIVLPMALPAMAAVVVFQFMWVWNDFFFAQVLVQKSDWFLSTQCVPRLSGQLAHPYDLLSAGAILTMIVPVALYLVLQRFYIRGLIGWTIKG